MSILVTGGAGFLGSHLIEHLLATTGENVVCLDNFNSYYDPSLKRANVAELFSNSRVTLVRGDVIDEGEMVDALQSHEVQRVVHLAGYPGVRYSVENPSIYHEVNVLGTLCVLEAARKVGVERLVFASSSTVYGRIATAPFSEDMPPGVPLSPYGTSKRAAELLTLMYHQLHGLPTVCARLFSAYGLRMRPDLVMSIFADKILKGMPITLFGNGSIRRDFTHVSDICRGLAALLYAPSIEGETFNLGHGEPISLSDLIAHLEAGLGRRAIVQHKAERPEDMPLTHADLAKSRRVLGYRPKVSFDVGCADYCAWYLNAQAALAGRVA